ncbi:HEAT repeat domain-containing protein [uncultured Nostoc sp.]|uniref:HEAT repeat domain-containing protein n=1 Tax=uncultured Nostoc sp. TaxID=340711 RepID=UPI0026055CCE|nr:HEAT repeat domain-containing protein [uncultured Nostoc sp.]
MVTTHRHTSKPSGFILYALAFIFSFFLALPWVSAKETPKPPPQPWQIEGILAALDDSYPKVKLYALDKLARYKLQDLKSVLKKPEEIAQKSANILNDEKEYLDVRGTAARALGNLGQAATKYIPDIANILKDEKVKANVRSGAAAALGNLGQVATKYIPDIANILKDEKVDSSVRSSAAVALGKLCL